MKKFFSLILTILMLVGVAASVFADDSSFSDVKTTRWSYEAIRYAVNKGYMNGVGDGKFDPAGSMTRGMVVTVLYRMYGSPAVEFEDVFTDVKAGKYYSNAVIWAKNNNIVNGVSEGKFDPSGKITREQLATMLNRYAEFEGKEFRPAGDLSKFPDADKAHSYAKNALIWATDRGLITGVKSGNRDLLDPRGNATREQFAAILKRYCEADLAAPTQIRARLTSRSPHGEEPRISPGRRRPKRRATWSWRSRRATTDRSPSISPPGIPARRSRRSSTASTATGKWSSITASISPKAISRS